MIGGLSVEAKDLEAAAAGMDGSNMSDHMAAMWAGQSNVLVAVRVRPIMKHDVVRKSCVRVLDSKVIVILDPATAGDKQDILRANRTREKQYAFDYAFEPGSSQEATYHHTTKFLIHGVLDGFSATVFAYGQTGSGKTHTMIGSEENPGIMVRVMSDLFKYSASTASKLGVGVYYRVTVSFLEVYNENIRDLLSASNNSDEYLDLREDPIKGPVVAGITEVDVQTSGEIMRLLHLGNAKRSQAATAANEVSSRSHAVLQVTVENRDRAPGLVDSIKVGKLSLIDLAGSERAANTQNRGARLVEGANINRSLLALGNCINALGEKGNKGNFVPYRDSKLTRLLKDSLGGNCRTVMIANISPAESSFEETLNTLKYANRAKNIKTQVKRNVLNVNYHISEYVELINNLRSEIKVLKDQMEVSPGLERPLASHRPMSNGTDFNENRNYSAFGENISLNGNVLPPPLNINQAAQAAANINFGVQPSAAVPVIGNQASRNISTPLDLVRGSLSSAGINRATTAGNGKDREMINSMRQLIVNNFQERMQLRRSLIELEDQNVQNSIEISKRELIVVNWTEMQGNDANAPLDAAELSAKILAEAPPEVAVCWRECEQIRKAVLKNNGMKRSIAKRLRHNEREAERVRDELGNKITGEDRRELMELQYQVGRLELENMELEQHRIVHESILKGKDLVIQKLKLQLAVKDKLLQRQAAILRSHKLDSEVGYSSMAIFEGAFSVNTEEADLLVTDLLMSPGSPLRTMTSMGRENDKKISRVPNLSNTELATPGNKSNAQHIKPGNGNANYSGGKGSNAFAESHGSDSSPYHHPAGTRSPRSPRTNEPHRIDSHFHPQTKEWDKQRSSTGYDGDVADARLQDRHSHQGNGTHSLTQGDWARVEPNQSTQQEAFEPSIKTQRSPPAHSGIPQQSVHEKNSSPTHASSTRGANGNRLNEQQKSGRVSSESHPLHRNREKEDYPADKKDSTKQISLANNTHKNSNGAGKILNASSAIQMPQPASRSVPSVYDSPSVVSVISNNGASKYEQLYPVAFNDVSPSGPTPQKSQRTGVQSKQHASPHRDESGSSSPRSEVPNIDSPKVSPRLMLGHELDEQSIETVVSEVSLEVAGDRSHLSVKGQHAQQQTGRARQNPAKHYQPSQPIQSSKPIPNTSQASRPVAVQAAPAASMQPQYREAIDYSEALQNQSQLRDKKGALGRLNRHTALAQPQLQIQQQNSHAQYSGQGAQHGQQIHDSNIDQPTAASRLRSNPYLTKAVGPPRPEGAPSGNPRQQFQRISRPQVKASLDTGNPRIIAPTQSQLSQYSQQSLPDRQQHPRQSSVNDGQFIKLVRGFPLGKDRENPPAANGNLRVVPSLQPYLNNNQQDMMIENSATSVNNLRKQLRNMSVKGNKEKAPRPQPQSARGVSSDPIMGHRPDPQIHSAR